MNAGYIYAFWHEDAPANTPQTRRIKIGRSQDHPWGNRHELRGEKLAFSFDTFGFNRQTDVFPPIAFPDHRAAETRLKRELSQYSVEVENGGRCSEAFDVPLDVFDALQTRTSI